MVVKKEDICMCYISTHIHRNIIIENRAPRRNNLQMYKIPKYTFIV